MSLDALKSHFAQATQRVREEPRFGKPEVMKQVVQRLGAALGDGAGAAGAQDRVADAIRLMRSRGVAAALRTHLRYLCWGLTQGGRDTELIADQDFPELLQGIEDAGPEVTPTAWRGLLTGYLSCPKALARGAAAAHWPALRAYLQRSLPRVLTDARFRPQWLEAIAEHANLLTDQPAARYAHAAIAGDTAILDDLREVLGIPAQSWLWDDLVVAQAHELAKMPPEAFLAGLDRLLPVVSRYAALVDECLPPLLTRYHQTAPDRPHQILQDFAVEHWSSPNLYSQARWGLVAAAVKQMVQEWLVLQDLSDFFGLLKDAKETDARRLDFWLRYRKQVSFARIALGSSAYYDTRPDYVTLRARKKGRYCRLIGAPSAHNAFIMVIGGHAFIEFSATGNATYGYAAEQLPFKLNGAELSIYELKRPDIAPFKEPHIDRREGKWEVVFSRRLAELGIHPDHQASSSFNDALFRRLCRDHALVFVDKRGQGGNLWVRHYDEAGTVASELRSLGFRFAADKGYWRK